MAEKARINVPSRTQVDKAGERLKNDEITQDTMETLSAWRSVHAYPVNAFQSLIRQKIRNASMEKDSVIAQRLKRLPSIVAKLKRFKEMKLSRMQDIGGIRVIVSDVPSVRKLYELIINSRTKLKPSKEERDYIKGPKPDGYRGLHQSFQYYSIGHSELNGLRIELQIRTRLQHAWATAVETLGMIENKSFKSGEGPDSYKRFFKIVSALFSMAEKCPVLAEFKEYSRTELIAELKKLENDLSVIAKLRGIAITSQHIDTSAEKSDYFVMILNKRSNSLHLVPFTKKQIEMAESFYSLQEEKSRSDSNLSVVLVSAGDISNLKKAYPNYFLDTELFIKHISELMKDV